MRLSRRDWILSWVLLLGFLSSGMQDWQGPDRFLPSANQSRALERITADSLRGHLSFIASDALQGRDTPSPGLDIAAEYIAAQFRRTGLEPVGDDGYFQTAPWIMITPNPDRFRFTLTLSGKSFPVDTSKFSMQGYGAVHLENVPVVKVPFDEQALEPSKSLEGKAVITGLDVPEDPADAAQVFRRLQAFQTRLASMKSALLIAVNRTGKRDSTYFAALFLRDPGAPNQAARPPAPRFVTVNDAAVVELFDSLATGPTEATISLNVAEPVEKKVMLRNVVALLRGSDSVLKDSYILLTAHYDHVGTRADGRDDTIWNGANDNGSGTVSVIEIASALATLPERSRRSLVFITFFGEEKGLLGSRYYARHPIFPLEKTVAAVNLEQLGRTDSTEGDQRRRATFTGFDYSDMPKIFQLAGEKTGVTVYKHERHSDAYFSRSDNQALADLGVPAHTLGVAFDFPDYHQPGDHWEKIDYDNMVLTDRMVALGLIMLAQRKEAPRWNAANPHAARYLQAWKERHGQTNNGNDRK